MIESFQKEKWLGGFVGLSEKMPFTSNTKMYNLATENFNNQNVPLLLPSERRYIRSEEPFSFQMKNDTLFILLNYDKVDVVQTGKSFKDAFLSAVQKHFPTIGTILEEIFFRKPQVTISYD